jgi:hypothetical protein
MNKTIAIKKGNALLKRMKGTGWKLKTWKNVVWHYCVQNGELTIRQQTNPEVFYSFLASKKEDENDGGARIWADRNSGKDPNELVERQLLLTKKVAEGYLDIISDIEKRIKEPKKFKLFKITKSFRGGENIYFAKLPLDRHITKEHWQSQLDEWGENTHGGYNYGYQITATPIKRLPKPIPSQFCPKGKPLEFLTFNESMLDKK